MVSLYLIISIMFNSNHDDELALYEVLNFDTS